jgi:5-hydroxyisourate hydrolase-like protein (transthyretin family)
MSGRRRKWGSALLVVAMGTGCGGRSNTGPEPPDNVTLSIAGTVTDQVDGAPLPGMTIGLWDILGGGNNAVVTATTDAAGHYQLTTVRQCTRGDYTTLVFDAIAPHNCYYMDAADSPLCTDTPQAFDFPLLRHLGIDEGCPWSPQPGQQRE